MSLPELLKEAKTGAPPPRYGVDDMVAAGKRRRRRRNREWAIVAAAVILAAVIGVPQILTRADGGPPVLPAVPDGPAPSPSISGGLAFGFQGYRTGAYQISEAYGLYEDRTSARVYRAGTDDEVGYLDLYRPGVTPPEGIKTGYRQDVLVWKYAADAYGVLTRKSTSPLTEKDMRQLAEGFATGNGRPVRVAYKVGYIPAGYRITQVLNQPGAEINTSNVTLAQGEEEIKFRVARHQGGLTPYCNEGCGIPMTGNRYLYISGTDLSPAEVRKIFDATVVVPDLESDASWYPVNEAFPTSAGFVPK